MVDCDLASVQKFLIHHALYGVVCIEARPACILFFYFRKGLSLIRKGIIANSSPRIYNISYCDPAWDMDTDVGLINNQRHSALQ